MWAHVVCATYVRGCIMAIWAISLRRSCLPPKTLPWTLILVFCPVKLAVDACPPVLLYTCVSSTNTLMFLPLANSRDSAWKPMSNIAPSPPITHSGFFSQPIWSQRIRTPMAYVGAFSNSELVHGTRYGLYGYVEVYTVLQPVAAMMPHWSPYFDPVAAHIMRSAVPSPQPAQEPAPPV